MNPHQKLVNTYAKTLLELSKSFPKEESNLFSLPSLSLEEETPSVPTCFTLGQELNFLKALLVSSPIMQQFYENPTNSEQKKLALLYDFFPGLSSPIKNFLQILAEKNHLFLLPAIADIFEKFLHQRENVIHMKIFLASPLPEDLIETLYKKFLSLTKAKEFHLEVFYNPSLIGGFVLEYQSILIDASLFRELQTFMLDF
jgi:F-type H+-transporting ATPase subunit delta